MNTVQDSLSLNTLKDQDELTICNQSIVSESYTHERFSCARNKVSLVLVWELTQVVV